MVERGAAKFPGAIAVEDMPNINQIILEGESLDRISRVGDVIDLPPNFFNE